MILQLFQLLKTFFDLQLYRFRFSLCLNKNTEIEQKKLFAFVLFTQAKVVRCFYSRKLHQPDISQFWLIQIFKSKKKQSENQQLSKNRVGVFPA